MDIKFYVAVGDKQVGPVDAQELKNMDVKPETLVWYKGLAEWKPAAEAPEVAKILGISDAEAAEEPTEASVEPETSSEEAADNYDTMDVDMPRTRITLSVIVTILIGTPFSILAIVYYCIAKSCYNRGSYEKGAHFCNIAHAWLRVAIPVGVIMTIFSLAYYAEVLKDVGLL